ncbi:MAG: rhombosortase [Pseudomonadales bacterium]
MTHDKTEWLSTNGVGIYVLLPICLTLQGLPEVWRELLLLQRDTFFAGQWWRLPSAHFVHLSWPHLGYNMLGLVVLQQLFGPQLAGWRCWLGIAFIAVLCSAALLAFSPAVQWYGGFSGVLTGMFVHAAITVLRQQALLAGAVLCIICAKIISEQWQGATINYSRLSAIPVVVDAHLYGALAGAVYATLAQIAGKLARDY